MIRYAAATAWSLALALAFIAGVLWPPNRSSTSAGPLTGEPDAERQRWTSAPAVCAGSRLAGRIAARCGMSAPRTDPARLPTPAAAPGSRAEADERIAAWIDSLFERTRTT